MISATATVGWFGTLIGAAGFRSVPTVLREPSRSYAPRIRLGRGQRG